ncbi:MAG: hypothetical protein J0M23_03745 [Rickettsiales bacterium]|nr:hypothetical protein [Rickettsiales bacterium]
MKKREKRIEEHKEHKSSGKRGEIVSLQDILKVLNKLTGMLPDSGPKELTTVKSKIALQSKKLEKTKLVYKEKEQGIARLKQEIENIQTKIGEVNNKEEVQLDRARQSIRKGLEELDKEEKQLIIKSNSEQSEKIKALMQEKRAELNKELTEECEKIKALMQEKRVELNKELTEKLEDFELLENLIHKPLQPSEMINSLIFPYHQASSKEILDKVNSLTNKTPLQELINTADSLISLATTETLKYKIDIRKDFLKTTKEKLPLVAKLPNKPGDEDNIGSFTPNMKNLRKAFVAEQEINDQRLNFLQKSADLLITLRGYLKIWGDPKLMPKTGTIDFSKDGMIGFLEPLLINLEEIVKSVSLLVKDFSLL